MRRVGHEIDMKHIPLSAKMYKDIEGIALLESRPKEILLRIRNISFGLNIAQNTKKSTMFVIDADVVECSFTSLRD